jgi:hypothetical protein|tara:strand:- start:1942 stop:3312 length:1371 start_codon:yes stop_codon:yes gene_type:complete
MTTKKQKHRDKDSGKFISSQNPVQVPEVKKRDFTILGIFLIIIVFFLLLILNNKVLLNSINNESSRSQTTRESLSEIAPSPTEEDTVDPTKIPILDEANQIITELDSTVENLTDNQLREVSVNPDYIGRILVQNGNVNIVSKGDLESKEKLYPGKIIKNGDQITVGEYPSFISFVLNNDNSIVVMYDNTNAQLIFNNMRNLYKMKKGKIHVNIMRSSKSTDFVSQNSKVTIEKRHSALMNLSFDKGQDQFVTIEGQATVINELSGLSLRMIKEQKLFSTNIGQLIWSLANDFDFMIGLTEELVVLPLEKSPAKKVIPAINKIKKIIKTTPKPKITITAISPSVPKPPKNYDKTRDYDFNIAFDIIKRESLVTYLETPMMGDIPLHYFPDTDSDVVSSISGDERFIVYPIYRFGFVIIGRIGTGPLGYADVDLINFSSEDRLGKIIDISKNRFIVKN